MNLKKKLLTIIALAICISSIKAQDKIFRKNGEVIKCKVTTEDSLNFVNFSIYKNGATVKTHLNKDEVEKIILEEKISSFERKIDKVSVGIGLGLDYGGIGINLTAYPIKYVGLFAGMGTNIIGFGFNAGAKFRYVSRSTTISPYATVMHGYNTVILVENASRYNKVFYGITYGLGMDFRLSSRSNNYFSLGLAIPQRGSDVQKYFDDLKLNHGVVFNNELPAVQISLGYRFRLN
jgi:hypothetical protein